MRAQNISIRNENLDGETFDLFLFFGQDRTESRLPLYVIGKLVVFSAERKGVAPPGWIKPIIVLSIPWAVSIHTVTAFLYAGLAARPFWLTAILAPRFLASAFAAGPALLKDTLGITEFVNADLIAQGLSAFDTESVAFQAGRVNLNSYF
mgnify:CR=1 FL=1